MPHQCTTCGRTFADGSKEMLSGCPDCGGNKFQFRPNGFADSSEGSGEADAGSSTADAASTTADAASSGATNAPRTSADNARSADAGSNDPPEDAARGDRTNPSGSGGATDPERRTSAERSADHVDETVEDGAQADARSAVVSEDEIAAATDTVEGDSVEAAGGPAEPDETADPDLDTLRQKLNDQFESIRIVSPGQYELNLMELYDREEYIISLREDGRYVIEMPEGWDDRE